MSNTIDFWELVEVRASVKRGENIRSFDHNHRNYKSAAGQQPRTATMSAKQA